MTFSSIKYHRLRAGLPQYQLAAAVRINPVRMSLIENLRVRPNSREQEAIAVALGVPSHVLFDPVGTEVRIETPADR